MAKSSTRKVTNPASLLERVPVAKRTYIDYAQFDALIPDNLRGKSDSLSLRRAEQGDAKVVASWITSNIDLINLGEAGLPHTPQNCLAAVNKWIEESVESRDNVHPIELLSAYVLVHRRTSTTQEFSTESEPQLLAFINATCRKSTDANAGGTVEMGRLVVSPLVRGKRYGIAATLVDNIALLLCESSSFTQVYSRIVSTNRDALDMIEHTLMRSEDTAPSWAEVPDVPVKWFRYHGHARAVSAGESLREFRKSKNMSQKSLQYATGISRSAINQYENARSKPSWSALFRLTRALKLQARQECELVMRLAGKELPKGAIFPGDISSDLDDIQNKHLWFFATKLFEMHDPRLLDANVTALLNGYQRFYFVPTSASEGPYGKPFYRKLVNSIDGAPDRTAEHKARAKKCLRLYLAPTALCALGAAIIGPSVAVRDATATAERITVSGAGDSRVELDGEVKTRFFDGIFSAVLPTLSQDNVDHDLPAFDGIVRIC